MKRNKLKIFTLIIGLIMVFTLSATAGNFKGKHHKKGMRHGGMGLNFLKSLNLNDEQKKMTADIIAGYKDEIKSNLDNMITARDKMADTVFNQSQDEQAVRKAFKDTSQYKEEIVVIRAKILTELKNRVLTPEQLEKLKTLRDKKKKMLNKRIEKKMSGIEDWLEN